MFPECKLSAQDVNGYIENVTLEMVYNSLQKERMVFSDFLNFISPVAQSSAECLMAMRRRAREIKHQYFGKTVRIYSPLYISSFCVNDCVYCGFRCTHKHKRKRLTKEEIIAEAMIIKSYGIDSLLLVSGEDPKAVSAEFLADVVKELKEHFSYVSIEIQPMTEAEYRILFEAGVHGLALYQETYNEELYKTLHLSGPKADYHNRLECTANGAKAGFYNIGLGALLGLEDWRSEIVSLAAHGLWLKKKYWTSKVQFSFPRITETEGGFNVPNPVSEADLEQIMLAFRLFFHEADLYISTRESAEFRKNIVKNCASHISGGSQVTPGGYAEYEEKRAQLIAENKIANDQYEFDSNHLNDDLGQFTMHDCSSVAAVCKDMKELNIEVIFKDWDNAMGV
ncbi:radical SAM protein [Lentisphaerota bacterium WC36G]|nr:radical SAM protein [Lentisphaerae bacterium WC36]